MICPNCNSQVPDGGFFCPECGMRIPQTAASVVAAAATEEPVRAPAVPQPEAPSYVEPVYPQPEIPTYTPPAAVIPEEPAKPKKEKKVKEKKPSSGKKAGRVILTVLLVILLLASAGLNVWQYMTGTETAAELQDQITAHEKTLEEKTQTIGKLESDVASRDDTIDELTAQVSSGSSAAEDLNAQIGDLNGQLEDLEKDLQDRDAVIDQQADVINNLEPLADNYEAILSGLSGYEVGYGADHFCADASVIVMSMAEQTRQFYLTAHWPEGGTVSMELSSFAADVDFDTNSWSDGTTMTVTAYEPGVCVAYFTNDMDSYAFKILIIVTE